MPVPTAPPTYTVRTWDDVVQRADKDWLYESRHPVDYRFSAGQVEKRDPGPESGIYEQG